jgi:hypothetical protein
MLVLDLDGVTLDGDPLFPFEVHIVKDLVHHIAFTDGIGGLEQPVCQSALAMVDMGDDAKIPDMLHKRVEGYGDLSDVFPRAQNYMILTVPMRQNFKLIL